jgi:hypothetical protein
LAAGLVHDGAGIIDAVGEAAARDGFAADLISGLSARHKQLRRATGCPVLPGTYSGRELVMAFWELRVMNLRPTAPNEIPS